MVNIDAFAFCRDGEQREGEFGLAELSRLRSECVSGQGGISWKLAGSSHSGGHPALHLTINGTMQLACQRCLTPLEFQIQSESTILLAKDESAADDIEATLEEDEIEVVVGSKTFDVVALIEDEALLAIPLSPKHEVCPVEVKLEHTDKAEKPDAFAIGKKESPFAGLKDQLMFGKAVGKTKN
jgi:uncharacterized protein